MNNQTTNPNHPAFSPWIIDNESKAAECGLTKREYFAAMAMQGLISHYGYENAKDTCGTEAIKFAAALITELNKVNP